MEVRGPPNNDLERAKLLYSKTVELEKQLRNELKKKSPLDRNITLLRNNIRDNFEQVLFLNYEFAISKDVEQSIWKSVFYRVIEEYRKRLRKPQQQQSDDELKRTGSAFKQFLTSAMSFYQRLLYKFQATFHLTLDGSVAYRLQDDGLVKLHRSYLSCHRCFIFMGDIARYHKDIRSDIGDTNPVWTRAAEYYQNALLILPDNGNPHNQLAVLATYEDDSFSGVYRYFRSLAIRQPFLTARDNLKAQFEKNRLKLETEEMAVHDPDSVALFEYRFVRLQGIFFNKTELDSIVSLKTTLLRSFSSILASNTGPNTVIDTMTILKLIAMLIFTVHNVVLPRADQTQTTNAPANVPAKSGHLAQNVTNSPNGHHAQQAVSPEDTQLQLLAVTFAFEFVAALARATYALRVIEPFDAVRCAAYLGCVGVFLEWVRVHPEFIPRTPLPTGSLWDTLAQLLNSVAVINLDTSKSASLPSYLEAEAELRGFLPLHNYIKTLPQSSLVYDPAKAATRKVTDSEVWNTLLFRVRKLREFGMFACGLHPQVVFYNKDTGLYSSQNYKPNSLSLAGSRVHSPVVAAPPPPQNVHMRDDNASVEDNSLEEEDEDDDEEAIFPSTTKFEFVEEDDDDPLAFNQPIAQDDDDFEDEVILFRPDQLQYQGSSQSNGYIRSNSVSPAPSPSPSPLPSPSLSAIALPYSVHNGQPNGTVQTRGAEFGIIGSRPKTPPQEVSSPARENANQPTSNAANSPASPTQAQAQAQPQPESAQSRFYSNFDFSSYYGLNHPFALSESAPTAPPSSTPPPTTPTTPLASLFGPARYSLFSADASPLPQVIDMPFQNAPLSQAANVTQLESGAHSPTCTNRDSPFAWLTPVPITLSNGLPSPPLYANEISATASPAPFLDSAILSADPPASLPFPFPGEPTLKFRTKNPFVNT